MIGEKYVLLADDDVHLAHLTLGAFADLETAVKIVLVSDGTEALDYLYKRGKYEDRPDDNPAVVLLDVKMPKVDGLEVLQQVKGDARLKVTPIVMLTSSRDERDILRSYQLGANAYVVKPAHFPEFIDVVKRLVLFWAQINEPPPIVAPLPTASPAGTLRI